MIQLIAALVMHMTMSLSTRVEPMKMVFSAPDTIIVFNDEENIEVVPCPPLCESREAQRMIKRIVNAYTRETKRLVGNIDMRPQVQRPGDWR